MIDGGARLKKNDTKEDLISRAGFCCAVALVLCCCDAQGGE